MQEMAGSHVEWAGQTHVHPIGLAAVLVLGATMLLARRRYALWPVILMACFIAPGQRIVIASLNFDFIRVIVVFGWVRVLLRQEGLGFRWRLLDWLALLFAGVRTLVYTVQNPEVAALINRLGASFDSVGMYFLFRILVRDTGDLRAAIRSFAVTSVPVCLMFCIEKRTGHNMFAVFGGVPDVTLEREGRLRCQGAFAHPILAGVFWASVLPCAVALWWGTSADRRRAVLAVFTFLGIVVLCASSTPVSAVMIGAIGMVSYRIRMVLGYLRWAAVPVLIMLHATMSKPIWHLIARMDFAGGSTGWHRFHLIDEAVNHFHEWWLCGTPSTAHWGWGLEDVTNQYILEGVRGGIWAAVLLGAMIAIGFREVGRALRAATSRQDGMLLWGLGVSLLVHAVSFVSISYFGQTIVVWYLTLAAIGSISAAAAEAEECSRSGVSVWEVPDLNAEARWQSASAGQVSA